MTKNQREAAIFDVAIPAMTLILIALIVILVLML
jgi:hypothetical protein